MKNLSLILNIVLLVAVAVLFYLHFSTGSKSGTVSAASNISPGELKIAYINSDTVTKYYDFLKDNRKVLEDKAKQLDQDYRNRAIGLQNEFAAYQRNVNSMTLGQVRATEEDLAKKQQNLQLYQQSLSQQVMEDEAKLSKELYDRVTAFLKKYSAEKGIPVILKYDVSSDVLNISESLDISQDVIKGLNDQYKTEKSGGPAKADSTKASKK
jgi:outer membrane protein